jgi:hypothetical protein
MRKITKIVIKGNRCLFQYSNRDSPKYDSRELQLRYSASFLLFDPEVGGIEVHGLTPQTVVFFIKQLKFSLAGK